MTNVQRLKLLQPPIGKVDVVIDTDAYNEIDDQFAISYLLKYTEKLKTVAIYAAPFSMNGKSTDPEDGMEKSYDEILKLLELGKMDMKDKVFKGSREYLPDENTPVVSPAAEDLAKRAMEYTTEKPLYVVAIGAITNVASALLINPEIKERMVLVWLGGHAHSFPHTREFNMFQDVAAARVVMGCGVPFVQLPCIGVVSEFRISKPELLYWLADKNPLADYLAKNSIAEAESYAKGKPWTRVIWDVTAVAWLLNEDNRFMEQKIVNSPAPTYDNKYDFTLEGYPMAYVFRINRDALMEDMINKLI